MSWKELAKSPKWIGFVLFGVLSAVLMTRLGLWQLTRLGERRTATAAVEIQRTRSPAPVADVVDGLNIATASKEEWRRVVVSGHFDESHQVLIANRSSDTKAGYHVVTPVMLNDTTAVLVNRGWIPLQARAGEPPVIPPAPSGEIRLTGRIRASQTRGAIGPKDPPVGALKVLARVDVARIASQTPYGLLPMYVEDETQWPGLDLIKGPTTGPGPHLGYALQWFGFTIVGIVAWIIILRRAAKGKSA